MGGDGRGYDRGNLIPLTCLRFFFIHFFNQDWIFNVDERGRKEEDEERG